VSPTPRVASRFGIAGPAGFLAVSFTMAVVRPELIHAHGWASWPSIMATGGPPAALPQLLAFLWLGACYAVFASFALRPEIRSTAATGGFLAVAVGDALLAFPTDVAGGTSWHGALHLAGVLLVTSATLVGVVAVTIATRDRRTFRPWRGVAWVPVAAATIGLVAGFHDGWAKVVYVVGITAPVIVLARGVAAATTEARSG
jgi:hypothetical protein